MAALSGPRNTTTRGAFIYRLNVPVAASTTIWKGSIVMLNSSGYAIPAATAATTPCMGIADQTVVNSGSAGSVSVDCLVGLAGLFDVTGSFTQADNGKLAYFSDDHTITRTATSNSAAGTIVEFVSTTACWVYFDLSSPVGIA